MKFEEAYQKMLEGKKVSRKSCKEYWFIDKEDKKIKIKHNDKKEIEEFLFTDKQWKEVGYNDWEIYKEPVWKPQEGELYYYINSSGEIDFTYFCDRTVNDERRICNTGNYFKTDEEAEHMIEKLKVIKKLQDFALEHNDEEINWSNEKFKYAISYQHTKNKVIVKTCECLQSLPFNLYFNSKKDAQECIELIGEERLKKYYFDVED